MKIFKARRSTGFSIVELMVAILIGLIILAGVIQVVITSKTSFVSQEEMSFIQENARYAIDLIGKDTQAAGYWGCVGAGAKVAFTAENTAAPQLLGIQPVGGYDGSTRDSMPDFVRSRVRGIPSPDAAAAGPMDYPDVLVVRGAEGAMSGITNHDGAAIETDRAHGLSDNSYFVVVGEDCRRLSVVRADTASSDDITYSTAGNCSTSIKPSLLKASFDCSEPYESYLPGATVMEYGAKAYYIGNSSVINGFPALKRLSLTGNGVREEELALGVEDMEVLYGVVSANGNVQYKSANDVTAAEWPLIGSVQVQLVFRSQSGAAQSPVEQNFLENTYNDGFVRQLVSTTFRLRNRI